MKLRVSRSSIEIIPEDVTDEAYIEEVLGLREEGDSVTCKRIDATGLSSLAYLEITGAARE